jgi:putative transposase
MFEYPARLHHKPPGWVKDGALFHVRIRTEKQPILLTNPKLAEQLLVEVRRYHELGKWWCELFLLMPDHVHALLIFPREPGMSEIVRSWKRGTARFQKISWQDGYFDHRLRSDKESRETWNYIGRNPVVKNLCTSEGDWPWRWSALPSTRFPEDGKRLE